MGILKTDLLLFRLVCFFHPLMYISYATKGSLLPPHCLLGHLILYDFAERVDSGNDDLISTSRVILYDFVLFSEFPSLFFLLLN